MKYVNFLFLFVLMLVLSGCGHGILIESETTGFSISVPIGEGTPLNVTVGMTKVVTATVRGGTTVETTSVAGGGIFSGDAGIGKKTTMKTNTQLNEGNLRDVFVSEAVPDEAKVILASNLVAATVAPITEPTVVQATTLTLNTGKEAVVSNGVPQINRISGVDKLIDTIPDVTTPVIEGVTDVANNVVDESAGVVNNTVNTTVEGSVSLFDKLADMCRSIKWTVIFKAICAIAVIIIMWLWLSRNKEEKPMPVLEEVDPNLSGAPVPPKHKPNPTSEDVIDPVIVEIIKPKEEEEEEEEKTPTVTKPWWKKLFSFLTSAVVTIVGIFMRIPADKRIKIYKRLKQWWLNRRK